MASIGRTQLETALRALGELLAARGLYAAADQGPRSRHLQDLEELVPDQDELLVAARWSRTHDPSPGYRSALVETLRYLGVEDADGRLD